MELPLIFIKPKRLVVKSNIKNSQEVVYKSRYHKVILPLNVKSKK